MKKTAFEVFKEVQELNKSQNDTPWYVKRVMPDNFRIEVLGEQLTFGQDFVTIEEAREALDWFVNELGGTVKWKKI